MSPQQEQWQANLQLAQLLNLSTWTPAPTEMGMGGRIKTRRLSTCKAASCLRCTSLVEPSSILAHLRALKARCSAPALTNGQARPLGFLSALRRDGSAIARGGSQLCRGDC